MNNKTIPAVITATLAAGASATAPYYDVNVSQKLCVAACADETPVFAPAFSVKTIETVGTNQYLIVLHLEGVISYVPCGCGTCCTRSQLISQDFTVPIFSATAITGATLQTGSTVNAIERYSCDPCSKYFTSDTPLTITLVE